MLNPHHVETSQSTHNASKLTGCNKTRAKNKRRPQNRLEFHTYLLFLNINQIIVKISIFTVKYNLILQKITTK